MQKAAYIKKEKGDDNTRTWRTAEGRETQISELMTVFLKHEALKNGYADSNGYVFFKDLLDFLNWKTPRTEAYVTEKEIRGIVKKDNKERFEIDRIDLQYGDGTTGECIRAVQEHSIQVILLTVFFQNAN